MIMVLQNQNKTYHNTQVIMLEFNIENDVDIKKERYLVEELWKKWFGEMNIEKNRIP